MSIADLNKELNNNVALSKQESDIIKSVHRKKMDEHNKLIKLKREQEFIEFKNKIEKPNDVQIPSSRECVHTSNKVSDKELDAVGNYIDTYGQNKNLRTGVINSNNIKNYPEISLMDGLVEKAAPLEKEHIVYRGVSNGLFKHNKNFVDNIKAGSIINDKAYVSTAKSADNVLQQFASNPESVVMRIKLPKGTKGINVTTAQYNEFILPRGSQIKVNSIENGIAECEYVLPS